MVLCDLGSLAASELITRYLRGEYASPAAQPYEDASDGASIILVTGRGQMAQSEVSKTLPRSGITVVTR